MSLFARLRSSSQNPIKLAGTKGPAADVTIGHPTDHSWQAEELHRRTWAAEDAARAMATRITTAEAERDQAAAEAAHLTSRVAELVREVALLQQQLLQAQGPRRGDRLCPACHDPMPFGVAHYCARNSTYREENNAA